MSDQPQINKDIEKYKNFQSFKDMLASGLEREVILNELKHAEECMIIKLPDEALCWLTANYLNVSSPKPNIKSKFTPYNHIKHSSTTALSKLKDVSDRSYVDIKGMLVDVYFGKNYLAICISNMKNTTVRCSLFDYSINLFKEGKFELGDRIKLFNVKVRTYNDKKEVRVNNYSRIIKLKDKVFKL